MATGLNTNRVFEGCEIIFIPISKNWREKLRMNQNGSSGKIAPAWNYQHLIAEKPGLNLIPEPRGNLVYNNFLQSVIAVSNSLSDATAHKEHGILSREDSDSINHSSQASIALTQSGLIEVKIVFVKNHPLKNKELVLKLYKDKSQTLMGESLTNPRMPPFIVETNGQPLGSNFRSAETKLALCRFNKWTREKQYPSATMLMLLSQQDASMEAQILQKEYELQLAAYSEEQTEVLGSDPALHFAEVPGAIEEELLTRKDYRNRFIFSIESDYYENKEVTFSVQTEGSTETEVTVYVPDVNKFILHDSELDRECRKRFKTCNLESREYPMMPVKISSMFDLSQEQERCALAITVKIDPNENPAVALDKPAVVEKCIIKNRLKLSYFDCQRILEAKSREDLLQEISKQKSSKDMQIAVAGVDEYTIVRDQLERLIRIGTYIQGATSDPLTVVPLDNFLFGDFLEKEGNRRHGKPPQDISNLMTRLEELMNRAVALNLLNSMREFALMRFFKAPSLTRFSKFKTALEIVGCQDLLEDINSDAASYSTLLEKITSQGLYPKRKFLQFAIHALFQDGLYDTFDKIEILRSKKETLQGLLPCVSFLNPLHNYVDLHNVRLLALCLEESLGADDIKCLSGSELDNFTLALNKFNTVTSEAFRVVKEISWYNVVTLPDLEKVPSFVLSRDKNLLHIFIEGEFAIKTLNMDRLPKQYNNEGPQRHQRQDKKGKRKAKPQDDERAKGTAEPQTHESLDLKLGFSAERFSEFTVDLA